MKKLLYISLLLCCLLVWGFTSYPSTELNIQNLCKKWEMEKYSFGWFMEDPSEKEKNDYLQLSSNMTFTSISEGKYEEGTWVLKANEKKIILSKNKEKESLIFIVTELTSNKLVVTIDDPSDADLKYLKLHFKH